MKFKLLKKSIISVLIVLFFTFSYQSHSESLNDYAENKIVDHVFRGTAFSESSPGSYYVGLHTTSCTDAALGTEVSGAGYSRIAIARSQAAWNGTHGTNSGPSSGTNGTISNNAIIQYGSPTANWGGVTSFSVSDAITGGNPIVCTDLTTAKTINNGDAAPSFAAGALTIQIDD